MRSKIRSNRPTGRRLLTRSPSRVAGIATESIGLALLLAWAIGLAVNDRYWWSQFMWWIPSVAAATAAIMGLISSCLLSASIRDRRMRWIWLGLCIITVGYVLTIDHRLLRWPGQATSDTEAASLRILHWNGWYVPGENRDHYIDAVIGETWDIAILTDTWHIPWTRVINESDLHDVMVTGRFPFAVLSRVPIQELRTLIATDDMYLTELVLEPDALDTAPLVIHIIDLPSDPLIGRMALARRFVELLKTRDAHEPDVMVGDFNITRGGASLEKLAPDMTHAWDQTGRGWAATYHRSMPLYHIDHVLLSPQWRAVRYELHDPGISRHLIQNVTIAPAK